MAELDQLTVSTKRFVRETPKLVDDVFQHDGLLKYAQSTLQEKFTGGRFIGENFMYNGLIGGAYSPGDEFDISEPQIEQELQFNVKFYEVNATLTKEEVQVLNKGPNAMFELVKSRVEAAYMTIGAQLAISQYLAAQGTAITGYTKGVNGLAEALNNGSTASWDGQTYSTYGTITRGGAVGTAINSVPTNVAGTIEYNTLEETYSNASFGDGEMEPNIGITTAKGYSYIKEKFQTQQRFNEVQDPKIGFNGMKFNMATLMKSRYCPGTYISGSGDPIATSFIKQSTSGASTVYPTLTAETLFWLNARKPFMNMYVSDDPEYQLGITGWKPAQGNTKVACQVLFAGAMTWHPRYHAQLYGITG